jgi:hypothetical protein
MGYKVPAFRSTRPPLRALSELRMRYPYRLPRLRSDKTIKSKLPRSKSRVNATCVTCSQTIYRPSKYSSTIVDLQGAAPPFPSRDVLSTAPLAATPRRGTGGGHRKVDAYRGGALYVYLRQSHEQPIHERRDRSLLRPAVEPRWRPFGAGGLGAHSAARRPWVPSQNRPLAYSRQLTQRHFPTHAQTQNLLQPWGRRIEALCAIHTI